MKTVYGRIPERSKNCTPGCRPCIVIAARKMAATEEPGIPKVKVGMRSPTKSKTVEPGSSDDLTRRHRRLQIHHQRVSIGRLPKNEGPADVSSRARHVID